MGENGWQVIYYSCSWYAGLSIMYNTKWWFGGISYLGGTDNWSDHLWTHYPQTLHTGKVKGTCEKGDMLSVYLLARLMSAPTSTRNLPHSSPREPGGGEGGHVLCRVGNCDHTSTLRSALVVCSLRSDAALPSLCCERLLRTITD